MSLQYGTRRSEERGESIDEGVVPDMQPASDVEAIVCSDLHLWHKAPVARSAEENWYHAMERPLQQIYKLKKKHQQAIVIYGGDIFDHHNPNPECINFALNALPNGYGIPGNHDLPYHSYADIKKSGYWTLVKAGKIINLPPGKPVGVKRLELYGFPWGFDPTPIKQSHGIAMEVAVVHAYIWTKKTGYPNAPADSHLKEFLKKVQNYFAVFVGDNHKSFLYKPKHKNDPWLLNCGGLLRRKADEKDYSPVVGLLHADGSITRHYLDTSKDKFLSNKELTKVVKSDMDLQAVLEEYGKLADGGINFENTIIQAMEEQNVNKAVRKIILAAIGERK